MKEDSDRDNAAHHYFVEYSKIDNNIPSNFLIIEVEGDIEKAQDLRYTLEKLEYNGLGMTSIWTMEQMLNASVTLIEGT
jgi:hypothetical protein